MTILKLYVITDRIPEPRSYLSSRGGWESFGKETQFFSKVGLANEALEHIFVKVKTMGVETIVLTVD